MSAALVNLDGIELNVERTGGEKRPLLLISGLGASLRLWGPLLAELNRATVAFDQPGIGGSPALRRPLRIPALASLTVSLLDELELDRVDVLGYSFGGLVAQQLAHDAPGRVGRLVLAGTHYGVKSTQPPTGLALRLINPMRNYSVRYARRTLPSLVGGRTAADPAVLEAGLALRHEARPSLRAFGSQLAAATGWGSHSWLAEIDRPTLVIQGDADPIVDNENARHLAATIPDGRLELVPGAGHMFLVDEAESAAPVIAAFLDEDGVEVR